MSFSLLSAPLPQNGACKQPRVDFGPYYGIPNIYLGGGGGGEGRSFWAHPGGGGTASFFSLFFLGNLLTSSHNSYMFFQMRYIISLL